MNSVTELCLIFMRANWEKGLVCRGLHKPEGMSGNSNVSSGGLFCCPRFLLSLNKLRFNYFQTVTELLCRVEMFYRLASFACTVTRKRAR